MDLSALLSSSCSFVSKKYHDMIYMRHVYYSLFARILHYTTLLLLIKLIKLLSYMLISIPTYHVITTWTASPTFSQNLETCSSTAG